MGELETKLVREALVAAVPDSVAVASGARDADFVLELAGNQVAVKVKSLAVLRIFDLINAASAGALQARKAGQELGVAAAVVVTSHRIGAKAVGKLDRFMKEYAPEVEYGVVDQFGTVRLHLPSLGVEVDEQGKRYAFDSAGGRRSVELFSDLNRWLLKVLLLKEVETQYWGGPPGLVANPTQLARVAGVSVEKAHRFFRAFEERDFVRRTRQGLQVVRRPALLEAWLAEEKLEYRQRAAVRSIFGASKDPLAPVEAAKYQGHAVAGFAACGQYGLLHAEYSVAEVYVRDGFEEALKAWDLEQCEERDAQLVLVRARYPESVFRGVVERKGRILVDVLQAALDVVPHAASGREQADFLLGHVLGLGESR